MKNLKFKTFSLKKLVLTILYTVIVSVFIGTTILFASFVPQWIQSEIVTCIEKDSEILIEIGKSYEDRFEKIEKKFSEDKELYGEDYPAKGIFLMQLINILSTNRIMTVYTISVLIGIALETIIYIVAVQNIKGKEIVIELFLAFVVLFIFITLLNLGYQAILNKLIGNVTSTDVTYVSYVYDLENHNILIPYIIVAVLIYIVNMVRQKSIANKLNRQLNAK